LGKDGLATVKFSAGKAGRTNTYLVPEHFTSKKESHFYQLWVKKSK
jgi:hypothetical protein